MRHVSAFLDPLFTEKKGETVRLRRVYEATQKNAIAQRIRRCPECGVAVSKYKDPHLDKAWCYCHDDLTPWSRTYLIGPPKDRHQKQRIERWTGKGRGNHG